MPVAILADTYHKNICVEAMLKDNAHGHHKLAEILVVPLRKMKTKDARVIAKDVEKELPCLVSA